MKVYVVIEAWSCDSGDCGEGVTVFSTIEKARKYLKKASEEYKNTENYDYNRFEEYTDKFSAYTDNEYSYNRTDLSIEEAEVDFYADK